MSKIRMVAVSAVLIVASLFATCQPASATDPSQLPNLTTCRTMKMGSKGPCVEALQYSLIIVGMNVIQDGIFGPQTRGAVVAFQSQAHLQQDGIAGPQTIAALDRMANSPEPSRSFWGCPQLKVGVTSPCVRRFRYEFNTIPGQSAYLPLTNTYSAQMASAVETTSVATDWWSTE